MLYELKEIKRMRKRLGIGQKELAKVAGVSQSLIAKVEAGKIEPAYNKVRGIFEALESFEEKEEVKARELMHKKIVFVGLKEKVKGVIKIMKQKGISQVPVLAGGKVCGLVSEKGILEKMVEGDIRGMRVEEVMVDNPPIVSLETSEKVVLELLKENQVVLVAEKGEVKGLISKSDVLTTI